MKDQLSRKPDDVVNATNAYRTRKTIKTDTITMRATLCRPPTKVMQFKELDPKDE